MASSFLKKMAEEQRAKQQNANGNYPTYSYIPATRERKGSVAPDMGKGVQKLADAAETVVKGEPKLVKRSTPSLDMIGAGRTERVKNLGRVKKGGQPAKDTQPAQPRSYQGAYENKRNSREAAVYEDGKSRLGTMQAYRENLAARLFAPTKYDEKVIGREGVDAWRRRMIEDMETTDRRIKAVKDKSARDIAATAMEAKGYNAPEHAAEKQRREAWTARTTAKSRDQEKRLQAMEQYYEQLQRRFYDPTPEDLRTMAGGGEAAWRQDIQNRMDTLRNRIGAMRAGAEQLTSQLEHPENYAFYEKGYRDAGLKDILWNSGKQGYYNSQYGEQMFKEMMGQENEAEKYREILEGEDYRFIPGNKLEEALSGSSGLIGQQIYQGTNARSLGMAGAAAGAAAIAGQMGPQVALPEEIVTVPAAALAGWRLGNAVSNAEIEAGLAYDELLQNGIEPKMARPIAMAVGGANGALEFVQLDTLLKSFKALDANQATKGAAERILQEIAARGVDVAQETAQEVAQEGVTIAGAQLGSRLQNGQWAYDAGEVVDRLADTAQSSALSFGVGNVLSGGLHSVQIAADQRIRVQKRAVESFRRAGAGGLSFEQALEAGGALAEVLGKPEAYKAWAQGQNAAKPLQNEPKAGTMEAANKEQEAHYGREGQEAGTAGSGNQVDNPGELGELRTADAGGTGGRRQDAGTAETISGERQERKVGQYTYRYTRAAEDQISPELRRIVDEFGEYGVEVDVYDGEIEAEVSGEKFTHSKDASTLQDGSVLVNKKIKDPETLRQVLAHEVVHHAKKIHPAIYQDAFTKVQEGGIDVLHGKDVLGKIAKRYANLKSSKNDKAFTVGDRLLEETLAQFAGLYRADPEYAREVFGPLFYDYDGAVAAIEELDAGVKARAKEGKAQQGATEAANKEQEAHYGWEGFDQEDQIGGDGRSNAGDAGYQSGGEGLRSARAPRSETRGGFIHRANEEGKRTEQIGEITIAYRETPAEAVTEQTKGAQDFLQKHGVHAKVVDSFERNTGARTYDSPEAVSDGQGNIYLINGSSGNAMEIGGHEICHVAESGGRAAGYVDATTKEHQNIFSDTYTRYISAIIETYFDDLGLEFDPKNPRHMEQVQRELRAFVAGAITADERGARIEFADCFDDIDTVIESWKSVLAESEQAAAQKAQQGATEQGAGPNEMSLALIRRAAGAFGRRIVVEENGNGHDGWYDPRDKSIHIAKDAKKPMLTVFKHELTHSLEGTKAYAKLEKFVLEGRELQRYAEELGTTVDDLARAKQMDYAERGIELSQEEARQEVVADYVGERLFTDEASIARLARQERSTAQKILDWIQGAIRRLRGTEEEKYLARAEALYRKALAEAENSAGGKTKYSFAGEHAVTADEGALASARVGTEFLDEGAEAVFHRTGWFQGAEGKWRFEIDDSDAKFNDAKLNGLWSKTMRLGDVLQHDALYAAYPQLRDVKIRKERMDAKGRYRRSSNTIVLNKALKGDLRPTLLHEVQHAIQELEGFARGGNRANILNALHRQFEKTAQNMPEYQVIHSNRERDQFIEKLILEAYQYDGTVEELAYEIYRGLGGEQEARETAGRVDLSAEERRTRFPEYAQKQDPRFNMKDPDAYTEDVRHEENMDQTEDRDALDADRVIADAREDNQEQLKEKRSEVELAAGRGGNGATDYAGQENQQIESRGGNSHAKQNQKAGAEDHAAGSTAGSAVRPAIGGSFDREYRALIGKYGAAIQGERAVAALREENQRLRERVDYWKGQTRRTRRVTTDKQAVNRAARELARAYGAQVDTAEIAGDLQSLYDYIAGGGDGGDELTYGEARRRAEAIGQKLVEGAVAADDEGYRQYSDLRAYLRDVKLTLDPADSRGIPDYGAFRKKNRGRLNLGTGKSNIDQVYQELSALWPEFFDEQRESRPADQLQHIAQVLDGLYDVRKTSPFARYMDQAVAGAANEILETFFDLPQARPTFADRQAQKLEAAQAQGRGRVQRVREQSRGELEALRRQNRQLVQQAIQRERARQEEQVGRLREQYQAKDAAGRERRSAAALRRKISRHAAGLSQKLLRPNDKQHIPEALRGPVAALLEAINQESRYTIDPATGRRTARAEGLPAKRTEAFWALKEQYARIAAAQEGELVIDPALLGSDAEGVQGGFDAVIAMKDIRLADMTTAQLETMWRVVRAVEHSVGTAGKVLSAAQYTATREWAEALQKDTGHRRTKRSLTRGHALIDMETPYTYFSHFGEAGKAIYRMLRDAQDRQQIMVDRVAAETGKIVDAKAVKALERETHTFTTQRGDELTLTTAQVMELYALMKRGQARDHLLQGGIVQPEVKGAKIRRGTDSILLTEGDLAQITGVLTGEQTRIADGLQRLTRGLLADYGNEASLAAYGYKKFTEADYWPIRSAKEGLHSNVERGGNNTRSIKNIGLAKATTPHAGNPLDIGGIFTTFAAHAADMTDYAAWLCTMEDANRLFNFKFRDEGGRQTGRTVKGLLDRVGGAGAQKYWHNLMEDIQNGIDAPGDSPAWEIIGKGIGSFKGAAVGGNIRVVIQQPTAFFRAAAVLQPGDMARGLAGGATRGNGWKKALQHSPIAMRKDAGGFDISSPHQMREILFDGRSAVRKVNDGLSAPAGAADAVTWGRLWNACEWATAREHGELAKGSGAFYKAVNELFTEMIDQTQVVDGVLQRSNIMRSSNAVVKQATSFMGEPIMSLNLMLRAYDQVRYEQDPQRRGKAIKAMGRAATALVVTNVVNALAQSLIDAMRDDDEDKKYWERFRAAFTGIEGGEESAWDKAVAAVFNGNVGDNMNLLGQIPFVKDGLSMLQGYNVNRTELEIVADLIEAGQTAAQSMGGGGRKTRAFAVKELLAAGAKVFGIPVSNLARDTWGLARSIVVETDNIPLQYEMEKAVYSVTNAANKGRYLDILFRALCQGDRTSYDHIRGELMEQMGMDGAAIDSAMRSRYKKAAEKDPGFAMGQAARDLIGSRDKLAAEAGPVETFGADDLGAAAYRTYSGQRAAGYRAMADGLEGSAAFQAMPDEERDKALKAAYDLADQTALAAASGGQYESGTKWIAQAADAEAAGIEPWQYVLFHTAYNQAETVKDKNGKAVKGRSKSDQVRRWLKEMDGLTGRQKKFLWGTVYQSEW